MVIIAVELTVVVGGSGGGFGDVKCWVLSMKRYEKKRYEMCVVVIVVIVVVVVVVVLSFVCVSLYFQTACGACVSCLFE